MTRDEIEKRLADTSAAVRAAENDRIEAVEARDRAIRDAYENKMTWVQIQQLTGLPPDSIRRSLARTGK